MKEVGRFQETGKLHVAAAGVAGVEEGGTARQCMLHRGTTHQ